MKKDILAINWIIQKQKKLLLLVVLEKQNSWKIIQFWFKFDQKTIKNRRTSLILVKQSSKLQNWSYVEPTWGHVWADWSNLGQDERPKRGQNVHSIHWSNPTGLIWGCPHPPQSMTKVIQNRRIEDSRLNGSICWGSDTPLS